MVLLAFLALEGGFVVYVHANDKLVDYYAYDLAATALAHGQSPYALSPADLRALADTRAIAGRAVPPYRYSPFLAALLGPLTGLPVRSAAALWSLGSVLALLGATLVLSRLRAGRLVDVPTFAAVAAFVPVLTTLYAGQVNHFLLLCIALVLWGLETGRARLAGAMLALGILLKTLPLALAAYLVWRRRWRELGWCLGALVLLVALTLPLTGFAPWADYLSAAAALGGAGELVTYPPNQSLWGAAGRVLGAGTAAHGVALATALAFGAATALATWPRRRTAAELRLGAALVLAATALAVPLSWIHHQVLLLPAFVVAWQAAAGHAARRGPRVALGGAYAGLNVVALGWHALEPWPAALLSGTLALATVWGVVFWLLVRPEGGQPNGGAAR